MLSVTNALFLKQSDVFLSGLLPLWMNTRHKSPFEFENTGEKVVFVSLKYRIVFLVNLSLYKRDFGVFETLCKCIVGLLSYNKIQIRFSVIIHGFSRKSKVIIQDVSLTDKYLDILMEIYKEMEEFECNLETKVDTDIFSTFEEGLQALDLLPKDYLPVLVYITDGVSVARRFKLIGKSHLPMRLVYGKVSLSIIQVGSENGFTPNTQFGNVPDNELLRFICILLSGRFLYAQDLPLITASTNSDVANFYHYQLLYREADYSKVVSLNVDSERYVAIQGNTRQRLVDIPRSRVINASDIKPSAISLDELVYPWKTNSLSPIISEILTSVREYSLPSSICTSRLITVRIREGFILRSINVSKRNKIEVTLTKPWDLHVTILYTIKAYNGWSSFFPMDPSLAASGSGKPLTVEVNVLAHHSFAILFVNMYMIGQSTNPAIEDLYAQLMSLDAHLKDMYALDDAMPIISSIEYFYSNKLEAKSAGTITTEQFNKDLKDYFSFICKNIVPFRSIFDTWTTDWILYSKTSVIGKKRQVAAIYLTDFLSKWCCITIDKQTYCKMMISDRKYDAQESIKTYGFVIVKILMKTEYVATGRFYFYNVDLEDRSKIIHSFQANLDRTYFPGTISNVMISCKRPLRKLMVSYTSVESSPEMIISNQKACGILLKSRWIWETKGDSESLKDRTKQITDTLYKHRVLEGFNTVFESSKCISFYLEHEFSDLNCSLVKLCSIQYLILISDDCIATELWAEPLKIMGETCSREYVHLEFKKRIFAKDQAVFTYYHTYSVIQRMLKAAHDNAQSSVMRREIAANVSKYSLKDEIKNEGDNNALVPIECNLYPLFTTANVSVIEFGFSLHEQNAEISPLPEICKNQNHSPCKITFINRLAMYFKENDDQELASLSSSKRNAYIFNKYFVASLNSFGFAIISEQLSEEPLFNWKNSLSTREKLGNYMHEMKYSDCIFFVKFLNNNCLAVVAVTSQDSPLFDSCICDSGNTVNTPVIVYECYDNPPLVNGDVSGNVKILKIGNHNHIYISKGEGSSESSYLQNLMSELEGLFYESWFKTACISLTLWGNIGFSLDHKILDRCIRKVGRFSVSNIIGLLNEANIDIHNLHLTDILKDWISVDCKMEEEKKTIWAFRLMSHLKSLDYQTIDQYFIELSIEGSDDETMVSIPMFHNFPVIPQSFSRGSSMVITVFYFEPRNIGLFDASTVFDQVRAYFNSFTLRRLSGSSVDCSKVKELLDDLNRKELPESIKECILTDEVSASLVVEEESMNEMFLDVLRETFNDKFAISIEDSIIQVQVVHNNRFWLFVEPSNEKYRIKGYSDSLTITEKNEVIESLKTLIIQVVFRVNQLGFLRDLNENRLASDYLINPSMVGMATGSLSSDLRYTFEIGAFECPLIFEYNFKLHHRVTAELALNAINGVMQPFAILNRPGMFVFLRKDCQGKLLIYYMHFVRTTASLKSENDSISLRMHGIEMLQEAFLELVTMIHSKLDALAINLVGTWISRNGAGKLLKDDFDILLPFDKAPPSKRMFYKYDTDPHAFLSLIRKKMIGCFCPMLESPKEIMDNYLDKSFEGKTDSSRLYCYHVVAYNCSSSREPTEFEKQVGIGLCSIVIILLDYENNPIEWKEPCLPLRNDKLRISVEIWPHETLNLDLLTAEIHSLMSQAQFNLKFSLELGNIYGRCKSEDNSLEFSTFSSIDTSLISNQNHHDVHHYKYHLTIDSYIAVISDIIFGDVENLCDGLLFLKKYERVDRGNEIQTVIVGFLIPRQRSNSGSPLSSNDLQLLSLSSVDGSILRKDPFTYSFEELISLEFFIISLQKAPHISTYLMPHDFAMDLNHVIYRWVTNFDLKNQNVSPIIFQGMASAVDPSHLAAIDVFEAFLQNRKDIKCEVFEREIQIQQWTAFPLINEHLHHAESDLKSKRYEWNVRYQKEILQTFGIMLKEHGYRQPQNMSTEPFRMDLSKISTFERYYYKLDTYGILNVVQSNIRGNYFYVSHFLISKEKGNRKDNLLRRLVVGLFEKHVKLTIELIIAKEPGYPCLLEKLKTLNQTFPKAPAGSRTFLVKGFYDPTDPNVSFSLFQYIFLNPQRYGFSPLLDNIGCYIRTKTPDFRIKTQQKTVEGEEYDYILILYYNRHQMSDTSPIFKYYIVVLNLTSLTVNEDMSTSEYIGGGYYLGDIVRNAEKRISDLLSTSLKYYSRDSLWRQLNDSKELICQESSEWITLFLEKISSNSRSFLAVDQSLENLFSNTFIDWNKALNHLCKVFNGHLLIQDLSTHFILYNELNSDYLVHISISNNVAEAFIVSREGVSDPIEWEAIDLVVNELLLFLISADD